MKSKINLLLAFVITATVFISASLKGQMYICLDPVADKTKASVNALELVPMDNSKWPNGHTIRVRFLNGSEYVKEKVRFYANEWTKYANIHFDFVQSGPAEIRINIDNVGRSNSLVGTDALSVTDQDEPTMNYGWLFDYTEETVFRRTVLHEFGHALGLAHEHEHAESGIQWNYDRVYAHYMKKPTPGWTKEQVQNNIFNTYSVSLSNSIYDRYSIMHYPIDASFTLNGYSVPWNTNLSDNDKRLIAELYPRSSVPAPSGVVSTVTSLKVEHNVFQDEKKGMKILQSFVINNARGMSCRMSAYFYMADGTPLSDNNDLYKTSDGNVASGTDFTPSYDETEYSDLEIFIPYDEFHLDEGDHKLKFSLTLWDESRNAIIETGYQYFTYRKGVTCSEIKVDHKITNEGLKVYPMFTVRNAQAKSLQVAVYYYDENDNPIESFEEGYRTSNDELAQHTDITPCCNVTDYSMGDYYDFFLLMPFDKMRLKSGDNIIKYKVILWDGSRKVTEGDLQTLSLSVE
jgi:hypothetical protein